VAKFQPELMKRFLEYYNAVTDEDGALTRRKKASIALALAHAKPCPDCIDASTQRCLEFGATPEQMTEAVHVAAALQAGISLIHGIQMHNAMVRDIG
jgi:alkylhydroperoxidase/carboxymuconolactone decarboxylase family protein